MSVIGTLVIRIPLEEEATQRHADLLEALLSGAATTDVLSDPLGQIIAESLEAAGIPVSEDNEPTAELG